MAANFPLDAAERCAGYTFKSGLADPVFYGADRYGC